VPNDPGAGQDDRDAVARREIRRACGIALLEATASLERGLGISPGAGAATFALAAFAARGRRLLRSAYRLIDARERDTAVPLFRVMNEYVIVGRWLASADETTVKTWALDDLRERLNLIHEVLADPHLSDETKKGLVETDLRPTEEVVP